MIDKQRNEAVDFFIGVFSGVLLSIVIYSIVIGLILLIF